MTSLATTLGPDDAAAAASVRAGDQAAFAALAERHRRELQVHCYRMLGSLEDAEDQVQETLLRAWRNRAGFEGRASFRAWLYRIATNACLDALARAPRRAPRPRPTGARRSRSRGSSPTRTGCSRAPRRARRGPRPSRSPRRRSSSPLWWRSSIFRRVRVRS